MMNALDRFNEAIANLTAPGRRDEQNLQVLGAANHGVSAAWTPTKSASVSVRSALWDVIE